MSGAQKREGSRETGHWSSSSPSSLATLRPSPGAVRKRKRIGRGIGSGHGKTSGRGHKGAGARSGSNVPPGYEGGQMPLQRRLPKRGFHNPFRREYAVVNLRQLERFEAGSVAEPESMRRGRLVRRGMPIKILGAGRLTKPLVVRAHRFSAAAREAILAVGGQVEELE